ncbi:hypothetical protein QBC38DRAFT_398817 [Podospora fimiseda]|uniref:2'-phosphotransferase n=1 Tax=Podospora fimiseda TaxID=252190 RepID=A0AAN7BIG4_9PEZI|nr:hypothetical protein QBC38DRAFT_398817 [Podospora fimiseda]
MATAVAVPLSAINNELGGVLPPSALTQHNPRHGRSRGMSFKGNSRPGSGRRYSVVEERDTSIAKALMFVVKRAIQEEEAKEDAEEDGTSNSEYLVADSQGWISVSSVLVHHRISEYGTDLSDIQRVVLSNAAKPRFELRQKPNTDSNDPSSWEISRITTKDEPASSPVPVGEKLTSAENLTEFIIYETSYQRYPLLLTLGGITRAPGGAEYHSFTEATSSTTTSTNAEVSIWIHLPSTLEQIAWYRSEVGTIVTSDEVPKSLWKKAVARRPDIGVLFEDGEVKKDVPAGLRGKGARGKGRKGDRGVLKRGSDDSGSASEDALEEEEE